MKIYFYNTMTRKKEEFIPIDKKEIKMYSCGPTVYNYAHLGNLRTYVFMDILRKTLKYNGYKIKGVLNITDVGHLLSDNDEGEDKIVEASKKRNKKPEEIAKEYTTAFFDDLESLNIEKPEIIAKATDNIDVMLEYCQKLVEKGFAYETSDGIYFDVSKFKDYGKLSGINLSEQKAGARVGINSEKRQPYDFALWKKASKNHIMQWDSPWGKSYPGWHLECSAMSHKYLGSCFDIHTGGVDHIPIHHENEIAQSQAYEGKKTVNYWLHAEFMLVNNGKMSKSLNNFYTTADLKNKGYDPIVFRYFCLNTHYRKYLNFSFEALNGAKIAYQRMCDNLLKHKNAKNIETKKEKLLEYETEFHEAINDDLNIPYALGIAWKALKENYSYDIYKLLIKFDQIFSLSFDKIDEMTKQTQDEIIPEEILKLANLRKIARKNKDFVESDKLRNIIIQKGYNILDKKDNEFDIVKK